MRRFGLLHRTRSFRDSRPTTSILYRRLDPSTLGRLIALYEHKIFTQGIIWGVNSFDRWGVELGKELAGVILPVLGDAAPASGRDSSTNGPGQPHHVLARRWVKPCKD